MPVVSVVVHPHGLHPIEAVKAWHKRTHEDMTLDEILEEREVLNVRGEVPGRHALWSAIQRVAGMSDRDLVPQSKYSNCGRHQALSERDRRRILAFVKAWRHKRFCTCRYIKHELALSVSTRTINRVLNDHGYYWRRVPRIQGLTKEQLESRKGFVDQCLNRTPAWWEQHMHMVLDGVTLTMPPKPLSARQKHAAQRITSMWTCPGETLNNDMHTFNRYGVQLGTKVALWGGFTGNGQFTLRLWTPRPKMTSAEWATLVPDIKAAVDEAYGDEVVARPWVWHDNERFLICPDVYKKNGLATHRFPPNSGDLNPIETVWAWLRRDLAQREQADIRAGRHLTVQKFRQRCAQILNTYTAPKPGEQYSRVQKLIRGMPRRLRKCRDNRYGRCGK